MKALLVVLTIFFAANTLYGIVQIVEALNDALSNVPRVRDPGMFGLGAAGAILFPSVVTAVMGALTAACWRGFKARTPKIQPDPHAPRPLTPGDKVMTESGSGTVVRQLPMTDSVIVDLDAGGTITFRREVVKRFVSA